MSELLQPYSSASTALHSDEAMLSSEEYTTILELQQSILEMVAVGEEDDAILAKLCQLEEQLVPNAVASIMMLDTHKQLNVRSAPSVPQEGIDQLNGLTPGPGGGSCGNAVYRNEPVFVSNTLTDPRWEDLRHVAENFGLCACWSMPVRTVGSEVIGSFALSSFEHREPNYYQRRLLEIGAFVVSIVTRRQEQEQLIKSQVQKLQLSAQAIQSASEGILITDAETRILEVNPSIMQIFGYTESEIIGQKPTLFSSGFHNKEFYRSLWTALENEGQWSGEIWNSHRSGEQFPLWVSISRLMDDSAEAPTYLAVYTDLSELHKTQTKLAYMAYHDSLTGLYNRSYLFEHLEKLIFTAMREKSAIAVLYLDLDRFKNLNDTFGHSTGDKILIQIAQRIKDALGNNDLCARIGGDEFIILLPDCPSKETVYRQAESILASLRAPFSHNKHDFLLSGSIGISMYPQDSVTAQELLKQADTAMYHAKKQLRENISFYIPEQGEQSSQIFMIESDLHKALECQEFMLYFQPKIKADTGAVIGAEALLRWQHPNKGMIPPNQFIPVAEESGKIIEIGEWVLLSVLETLERLSQMGHDALVISLNVSGRQVNHVDIARFAQIIEQTSVPKNQIELELTETFLMQNPELAAELVEQLHQLGVRISIDDFGSGYSSLSYLKRFRIDCLKIDQLLIRDIVESDNDLAIARAVVALGHSLGLSVIAEGVETEAQQKLLLQSNCDTFQGYYFAKPMPEQQFIEFLNSNRS
jgi:diguanylate cyclase (GGDEF)-like protein/PAS domain S-box-containing protein